MNARIGCACLLDQPFAVLSDLLGGLGVQSFLR